MFPFSLVTPTKIVFGPATETRAGGLVREFGGTHVLLHFGGGSAERSGLLGRVRASLEAAGVECTELGGVVPNPRISLVRKGVAMVREAGIDFILGVGGGSVMDSCKAIGYGAMDDGDVWDFYEHTRKPTACMSIGCIVTMAAAGSEMSDSSVLTNEDTGQKRGAHSDSCRPRFAILNPELTLTLPDYQTSCGNADIFMHTLERYFPAGDHSDLTDSLAEGLLRTVMQHARILVREPGNVDSRAEMLWASELSHNGLTGCGMKGGDFATHALEHEISGMFDVAHGAGLTAVWGSWARYVCRSGCLPRFVRFATQVMGVTPGADDVETALRGIEAAEGFFRELNLPTSLKELGLNPTEAQLLALAKGCAAASGGSKGTAMVLHEEDMLAIYRMAL